MKSCTYPVKMCAECAYLLHAGELDRERARGLDCFMCTYKDRDAPVYEINAIEAGCELDTIEECK